MALILFYMSYLFFGASVYYTLEQELETADREEKQQKRIEIYGRYLINYKAQYLIYLDPFALRCGTFFIPLY